MAEHIDRETALSFPFANGQYDREHADEHFINGCESYREWLEQLPASDVVEVVRCKDCHRSFRDFRGERYCNHLVSRWNPAESPRYVNDHDYCSWGVREADNG